MTYSMSEPRIYSLPWRCRHALLREIDRVNDFHPAGVRVVGPGLNHVLRRSHNGLHVVVELRTAPTLRPWETGEFWGEVVEMGLNCGAFILLAKAGVFTSAAVPVTGGASAPVAALAVAGAWATAGQCYRSLHRVQNELLFPGLNERLDEELWYRFLSRTADGLSVVGGGATFKITHSFARRLARESGRRGYQFFKPVPRSGRKRLAKAMNERLLRGTPPKKLKKLMRVKKIPKAVPQHLIRATATRHLLEAVASALSIISSSTRGLVREVAVYYFQEAVS